MNFFILIVTVIIIESSLANIEANIENVAKGLTNSNETQPPDTIKSKKQNSSDLIEMHTYARLIIPKNSAGVLMFNNLPIFPKNFENLSTPSNVKSINVDNILNSNNNQKISEVESFKSQEEILPLAEPLTSSLSSLSPTEYLQYHPYNVPWSRPKLTQFSSYPLYAYNENYYKSMPYWFRPNNNVKLNKPNPLQLLLNNNEIEFVYNSTDDSTNDVDEEKNIDDNNLNDLHDSNNNSKGNYYLQQQNDDLILHGRNNLIRKVFDTINPYGYSKYHPSSIYSILSSLLSSPASTSRMQTDLSSYKLNPFNIGSNDDYNRYSSLFSKQYPWQYLNMPSISSSASPTTSFYDNNIQSPSQYLKYKSYLDTLKTNDGRRDFMSNYMTNYSPESMMDNGQRGATSFMSDLRYSLRELKTKIAQIRQYMENKMQEESS